MNFIVCYKLFRMRTRGEGVKKTPKILLTSYIEAPKVRHGLRGPRVADAAASGVPAGLIFVADLTE